MKNEKYYKKDVIKYSKIDMNGVAMAPYGLKLSRDGATDHINLLEPYLALYKPPGIQKMKV